ncbi:MAG: ATP-binding protein [Desulfobacteraceae bacterium]
MRIAIIGGGSRGLYLINLVEQIDFQVVDPVIVAVADLNDMAVGYVRARETGIFVTTDYNDLFLRDDIDLLVELTGDLNIYNDIIGKKQRHVRVIAHTTARLFWEISHFAKRQKNTNHQLKITNKMYDVILNGFIQEDIIVIGSDYIIKDVNESFLEKLGLSRDEVLGSFCYEVTHHQQMPCSGNQHPCPLKEVYKTGKPATATHVHLDRNERKIYYAISCYPFFEDGEIIGAVEVSRDITKDIKLEKAMMQQEKLVSIGRLSAGVAHEINNPLTTILTSSMLAQEECEKNSDLYQELETISQEALRCRKIVKSLLDFARKGNPVKKPGNINDAVQASAVLTKKQAEFNDVNLETDFEENLPFISFDKDQLQQTIINLILNAVEATPGGGKVTLVTRHLVDEEKIEIQVSDTGSGISAKELEKIFDPFFTTKEEGTGLGLAITHGIVEQHGGAITVDSTPGRGTSFFIRFPVTSGGQHDRE